MEQPESAQNLEQLVNVLEERRKGAVKGSRWNAIVALTGGFVSAVVLYTGVSYELQTTSASQLSNWLYPLIDIGLGGLTAAVSLIFGGMSVTEYYHSNSLADRIAVLKESPGYKAHEGFGQKS